MEGCYKDLRISSFIYVLFQTFDMFNKEQLNGKNIKWIQIYCIENKTFEIGETEYPQIEEDNEGFLRIAKYKDKDRTLKDSKFVFYIDSVIGMQYELEDE